MRVLTVHHYNNLGGINRMNCNRTAGEVAVFYLQVYLEGVH